MITSRRFCYLLCATAVMLVELPPGENLWGQEQNPNGQIKMDGKIVPKYVDPLPHFAGTYPADAKEKLTRVKAEGKLIITAKETEQVVLPSTFYKNYGSKEQFKTKLWGYEIRDGNKIYPALWPANTLEAKQGKKTDVTYINELTNNSLYRSVLTVDQTLHWADPDRSGHSMAPYVGFPPIVTHLHGGEVASESDGGPDAWFTRGYAKRGSAWKAGVDENYVYPNTQEAATLWFHDHALGVTRLNVYAGLAGFYILRGSDESSLKLPEKDFEIEMAIQDRMFDKNGQLYFPAGGTDPDMHPWWLPEFFGDVIVVNGKTWPYLEVEPRRYRFRILNGSNARFYRMWIEKNGVVAPGPSIWQIGADGGLLDTPVELGVGDMYNAKRHLLLAPGERADVIIDFAKFAGQTLVLRNGAPEPFPGGVYPDPQMREILQFRVLPQMKEKEDKSFNPATAGSYSLRKGKPLTKLADFEMRTPLVTPDVVRQLTLNEVMGMNGPAEILVNNTTWDGMWHKSHTDIVPSPTSGSISEKPTEGNTEIWKIINLTGDAHPIHLHLVQFQLISRQGFDLESYQAKYENAFPGGEYKPGYGPPRDYLTGTGKVKGYAVLGGNPDISDYLSASRVRSAEPGERGWKDTFIMYPGEVTTVIARWAPTDLPTTTKKDKLMFAFDPSVGPGYVWHCHIIDHEDNEMMRPYAVQPSPYRRQRSSPGKDGAVDGEVDGIPTEFALNQNFPNPFNPTTEILFSLPTDARVRLTLFNTLGQEVKTVLDSDAPAGYHSVQVDATGLASGMYIYRLEAGGYVESKKMVLLR